LARVVLDLAGKVYNDEGALISQRKPIETRDERLERTVINLRKLSDELTTLEEAKRSYDDSPINDIP